MNIKKFLTIALGFTMTTTVVTSCVQDDEWDTPPIKCENRFGEPNTPMAQVAAMAPALGSNAYHTIDTNVIFDGYVVSSDEEGNFYKTIVFQDKVENPTVGLQISVDNSNNYADFPVGSHIRINAKGLRVANDRGIIKLGSADNQYLIGRIPAVLMSRYISGVCNEQGGLDIQTIVPKEVADFSQVKNDNMINTLVKLPVQFEEEEISPVQKRYVEFEGTIGSDTDRKLQDQLGGSAILRTAKYADFGYELLPKGSGEMTFIVTKYQKYATSTPTWQMIIRDLNDVELSNDEATRFDGTPAQGGTDISFSGNFTEDFESYDVGAFALPKYLNDPVEGNRYWKVKSYGGAKYLQLNAYNAQEPVKTSFAVPVDLSAANSITFDIKYGYYNGNPIKVYLSTDYTAQGTIENATLTDITGEFAFPPAPQGNYGNMTNVGTYNLPASVTGDGFLIFVYEGAMGGVTTTVQLDNIVVQ